MHPQLGAMSAALSVGLLLVGCAGEPAPRTHTVEIRDMAFHPAVLRVPWGDTVVWVNHDFVPHTATAPDSSWSSPPLSQGQRWRMVVGGLDIGPYVCAFHPVMEAHLTLDSSNPTQETP